MGMQTVHSCKGDFVQEDLFEGDESEVGEVVLDLKPIQEFLSKKAQFSQLQNECRLLEYTKSLRENLGSRDSSSLRTIVRNLSMLLHSQNDQVRHQAAWTLHEVLVEEGITSLEDTQLLTLLDN
jgi:hypothetical protein